MSRSATPDTTHSPPCCLPCPCQLEVLPSSWLDCSNLSLAQSCRTRPSASTTRAFMTLKLVSSSSNNHDASYDLISGSSIRNHLGNGALFLTDLPSSPSVQSLPSSSGHSCLVQRRLCDPTWHFLSEHPPTRPCHPL